MLQVKAVMRFVDLSGTPDMLCSSVFDRDDEFFATAGVSRKIKVIALLATWQSRLLLHSHWQPLCMHPCAGMSTTHCCLLAGTSPPLHPCGRGVSQQPASAPQPTSAVGFTDHPLRMQVFELAAVEDSGGPGCFPVAEMQAQHKLSCLVWSGYLKSSLLAADYAGVLQMWDVNQRTPTTSFHQHTKRVWSADFCPVSALIPALPSSSLPLARGALTEGSPCLHHTVPVWGELPGMLGSLQQHLASSSVRTSNQWWRGCAPLSA